MSRPELDTWVPARERGVSVLARIDRADRLRDGTWQVIDWKTGGGGLADQTDRQLDIGHLAVRTQFRLGREADVMAVAWNLQTGDRRVRPLTRQDARRTVDYVVRIAQRMQAEIAAGEFPATPNRGCTFCPWRGVRRRGPDLSWLDGPEDGTSYSTRWHRMGTTTCCRSTERPCFNRGMPRVILLKGLPASGKSTWAREQVRKHPGRYKRVNKDDLRDMLDAGEWSEQNERFVLKARDRLILAALESGRDVIVDDTNLNPVHEREVRDLVKGRATVEVKAFDVDVEEAIRRDHERARSVGEAVIREMHERWLGTDMEQPPADPEIPLAIICDLDGTLALLGERSPYDASRAEQDLPNEPVIRVLLATVAYEGARVFLVSGREERFRKQTERC
jgi:predicted kinase